MIGNNAAPFCPLDFVDSVLRGAILATSDYSGNATAVASVTSALTLCMGKSCYLPPGSYYISSTLTLQSNTVIEGAGRGNTFIYGVSMPTLPAFSCIAAVVGNLRISNLYVGGNISSAMDFTPATNFFLYASKFEHLTLVGGTSHAYNAPLTAFENTFDTVSFSTTGEGYGCVSGGSKELWLSCSLGPFGSNSSIGIKTIIGGTFINVNALYYSGATTAAKVFEFGRESPVAYPRVYMINCNFEAFGVTAISILSQSIYGIYIAASSFQPLFPAPIRSYIDDLDTVSPLGARDFGLTLINNVFVVPTGGYNTTANPTSSQLVTKSTGAPGPVVFQRLLQSDYPFLTFANGQPNVYRIYSNSAVQFSTVAYTGDTFRLQMPQDIFRWSSHVFVNYLNVLGGSSPSTLAAGTTLITLPSSLSTPSGRRMYLKTANTAPTTIAAVVSDSMAFEGTFLWISIGDSFTTIAHNATGGNVKFALSSGVNELAPEGSVYCFMFVSPYPGFLNSRAWRQVYGPTPAVITAATSVTTGQLIASGNTPTLNSFDQGACTGGATAPVVNALAGKAGAFLLSISTGDGTCVGSTILTINLGQTWPAKAICSVTNGFLNQGARGDVQPNFYIETSSSQLLLKTWGVATPTNNWLLPLTPYIWQVMCTGY